MSWQPDKLVLVRLLKTSEWEYASKKKAAKMKKEDLTRSYNLQGVSFFDGGSHYVINYYGDQSIIYDSAKVPQVKRPGSFFVDNEFSHLFEKDDLSLEPVLGKYVLGKSDRDTSLVYQWTQTYKCTDCYIRSLREIASHIDSKMCRERRTSLAITQSKDWVIYERIASLRPNERIDWFMPNEVFLSKFVDASRQNGHLYVKKTLQEACVDFARTKAVAYETKYGTGQIVQPHAGIFIKEELDRKSVEKYLTGRGFQLQISLRKAVDRNLCQCGAPIDSDWAYTDGKSTIKLCKTHGEMLAVCFDEAFSKSTC